MIEDANNLLAINKTGNRKSYAYYFEILQKDVFGRTREKEAKQYKKQRYFKIIRLVLP
jgi:hypothetical protein